MDFKTEMAERTAQIEQIIKKYLPKEEGYQKTIMEAMKFFISLILTDSSFSHGPSTP